MTRFLSHLSLVFILKEKKWWNNERVGIWSQIMNNLEYCSLCHSADAVLINNEMTNLYKNFGIVRHAFENVENRCTNKCI